MAKDIFRGRSCYFEGNSVRFTDDKSGVATTTYSHRLDDDGKAELARRIAAALNLVQHLHIEAFEDFPPIGKPKDGR